MITPIDFRQKTFRTGIGYDKKDVDSFMVELLRNYEELYRSNAQQIAEIKDLNDNLIRYKAMEESLQRELMVAEKTAEEIVTEAETKAKKTEADAKAKAKELLKQAKSDYALTHKQTVAMAQMYASMKAQLNKLFKNYVDMVNGDSMSIDVTEMEAFGNVSPDIIDAIQASDIVPEMNFAASAFIPNMPMPGGASQAQQAFGSYEGDPQMRDESPLAGMADGTGGTISGERGDVSSAGFGYSSLAENDTYKDPFAGVQVESTNEFDDNMQDPFAGVKVESTNEMDDSRQDPFASTKAKSANKKAVKDEPAPEVKATPVAEPVEEVPPVADTVKDDASNQDTFTPDAEIPTVNFGTTEEPVSEPVAETTEPEETYASPFDSLEDEISEDEALEGDIEDKPQGTRLIGDGEDPDAGFDFFDE